VHYFGGVLERRKPIFWAMLVLGFLGLAIASLLTQHFYELREGLHGFHSFCSLSPQMDCDAVASSRYAEILPDIPVALMAIGWFLAWCLMGMLAFYESWEKRASAMLALFCFVGTFVSLGYFFVMAVGIRAYCLGCLGIDFIHFLGLGFSWRWLSRDLFDRKCLVGWGGVLGLIALPMILVRLFGSSETSHWVEDILNTPVVSIPLDHSLSFGSDQAPITVVEFSDFQCSACRKAAFLFQAVKKRYREDIRFVFKNYPLDRSCNSSLPQTLHPAACEAAMLALCAHRHQKFEEVYEVLFNLQQQFVPGTLFSLLEAKGFSLVCSESDFMVSLERDIQDAQLLGVKATPTFFINGHKMEGIYPVSVWNEIIDRLLASLP
jgi:protein-disulfide isomerase/uncharacterized membrane protein